jgi:hypothetical protein
MPFELVLTTRVILHIKPASVLDGGRVCCVHEMEKPCAAVGRMWVPLD